MTIRVEDPFDARSDPALPTLALALDPQEARRELKKRLSRLSSPDVSLRLRAIRVTRHKPGRRCVIEYDLGPKGDHYSRSVTTVIGKIRAKRFGNESFRLLNELWQAGFGGENSDGVSVPEPLGVIPRFLMWCQRKVPGKPADALLPGEEGIALARKIAQAAYKVHCAGVTVDRRHTIQDELRILAQCFENASRLRPDSAARIGRIRKACERLASSVPERSLCGIHRDFYPAQVIVDVSHLYLIDFDLYCLGDPALDIGNFIAHMTEQALRELGDPGALQRQERAMEEAYIQLAGEPCHPALGAYTNLSLARHIYLSTQFPDRQRFTEALIELCESRLHAFLV